MPTPPLSWPAPCEQTACRGDAEPPTSASRASAMSTSTSMACTTNVVADELLVGVGRKLNVDGLGLRASE